MSADIEAGPGRAAPLRWLRHRLATRSDSEHEQALVRLFIVTLIFSYFFVSAYNSHFEDPSAVRGALISGASLGFSVLLFTSIVVWPGRAIVRRLLGMVHDLGVPSYGMYTVGELGAPLVGVYLWVTMGNGFRYGIRYLYGATAVTIIGFTSVILLNDYWANHTVFGASLLIVLGAIPLYMASLLRKLNDAIHRANEASQAKTRFLANMSHELRTPLNGVIGMSDLLVDTNLNREQRDLAHTILASARTLLDLIENILDISKIESGKLSLETIDFDLHRLVHSTVMTFECQAQKKSITLATRIAPETPFLLRGDPMHVRQVLINLVSNAIKFTHEGRVEVRVKPLAGEDDRTRIRFAIVDTGIGIGEEAQARIFESFTQADASVTRRFGGTGLGTTIARQLVGLMGGRIGLSSAEGKGTTFWFELPFDTQSMADEDAVTHNPLSDTRVLVLASEGTFATLREYLSGWQVEGDFVTNSARAFSFLMRACEHDAPYHVVVVEQRFLDMRADQFGAAVRADPMLRHLSLILLDTAEDTQAADAAVRAGYSSVVHTPPEKRLFFNALHAARTEREGAENVVSLAEHYRQRSAVEHLRILVAEDNETNQKVIRGILERVGHEVHVVGNGEEALDALDQIEAAYDLVLLDMNMPGLGGLDVLKVYRFMHTQRRVPVVMLTADATRDAMDVCKDAGADAHLTKPVHARRLLDTVAELGGRAGKKELAQEATKLPVPRSGRPERTCSAMAKVDEHALENLVRLGAGPEFVEELVEGFARDGERIMAELGAAVAEQDYRRLRDAVHGLKGSAGELGGAQLVCLCIEAESLKPYQVGASEFSAMVERIKAAFDGTCVALTDFLERQRDAMT